ncbi:MAG: 4-(cytidine 5'-diphospho)-2-C-methyl-D-erythritol kinase [Deltaproteobacteria bacterium]|nr:4-(cytidine 5'-diphospho)-2-C-methyl-D-erythritol kinase [Deltaproteobacteria bacterium]
MTAITVRAPAKINLFLRIVGRRTDGYHLLQMLNVPLQLADTLFIESPALANYGAKSCFARDGISLVCEHPEVPLDETNLCYRAAEAMRAAAARCESVRIAIEKQIPIGGGLGGGSSDVAAVLCGLNHLWQLGWPPTRLAEIGVRIGADVPFFCLGQPAMVEGIGEQVTLCRSFPKTWILLVNPRIQISTPWAYQQYDLGLTASTPHVSSLPRFLERFEDVAALVGNDLESVVANRYPVVREMIGALRQSGAAAAGMTGSGSTVFGLFATRERRDSAVRAYAGSGWLVIPTESVDSGA